MGKFDGFMIFTDFDNTFTLPGGKEISKANIDAVRYFQKEGGLFTVATGRSPNFISLFEHVFRPNAPLITLNGTMITTPDGQTVLKEYQLGEDIMPLVEYLLTIPYMECVYFGNGETQYNRMMEGTLSEKMAYYRSLSKPWYKAVTRQPEEYAFELMADLENRFGDRFAFDRSYSMGIEIHTLDSGKGACMDWVKAHLKQEITTTVAVGDYENDVSMFKRADISYAVANAPEHVKKQAGRVTVRNDQDAMALIIEELGKSV
ncbi:MAG: HAD-IIB family hydrolase [Clostridia bacterium]|nr:HAD-IIB family hydrolase [Clostridia bacterium]